MISDGFHAKMTTGDGGIVKLSYVEITSTHAKPRLPGDGCGCERFERDGEYGVRLCSRHGSEPYIHRYMLVAE